jgi:hypothetical protein
MIEKVVVKLLIIAFNAFVLLKEVVVQVGINFFSNVILRRHLLPGLIVIQIRQNVQANNLLKLGEANYLPHISMSK